MVLGASSLTSNDLGAAAYVRVTGASAGDEFGASVSLVAGAVSSNAPGDLDGDGFYDPFVGANTLGSSLGTAWIAYGGPR